jgi:uncharacterized protein (TIGR03790 family)
MGVIRYQYFRHTMSVFLFTGLAWTFLPASAQFQPKPARPFGPLAQGGMAVAGVGTALQAEQLALIVNDEEANSVAVAELYRQARNVPAKNIVHVRIPGHPRKLSAAQFAELKRQIDAQLGPQIQAVLMVWTAPYAVECNSITSAFTLGYDASQCEKTCAPGKPSAYFNSSAARPFTDAGVRISMLLPTDSVEQAKALIGRGVASGFRAPKAGAYFLVTSDNARNSRAQFFPPSGQIAQRQLTLKTMKSDSLEGAQDVIIYQTGLARVAKLDTLHFLPGALADHLTSAGGDLLGNSQMSSLRWLEAGATASYGAVSEPCNYWQKFPQPTVLLRHYLMGETAIEAYWKSVAWPAQGVFIGEPLAAPYAQYRR